MEVPRFKASRRLGVVGVALEYNNMRASVVWRCWQTTNWTTNSVWPLSCCSSHWRSQFRKRRLGPRTDHTAAAQEGRCALLASSTRSLESSSIAPLYRPYVTLCFRRPVYHCNACMNERYSTLWRWAVQPVRSILWKCQKKTICYVPKPFLKLKVRRNSNPL